MMNYPPPTGPAPAAQQRHRRSDRYKQDGGGNAYRPPAAYQPPENYRDPTAYQPPAAYQPPTAYQAPTPYQAQAAYQPPTAYQAPAPYQTPDRTAYRAPAFSEAPAAAPSRSAAKPAARKKSGAKKREGLSGLQWTVLFLLIAAMGAACFFQFTYSFRLRDLMDAREKAAQQYRDKVDNDLALQSRYRKLIEQYAAEYGVNPAYVSAIIMEESHYDPRAVSSKGARGLMQFMPDTFDWVKRNCGYKSADFDVVYQPEAAIKMGCYLLKYIIGQLGTDDPILVACAYHAGWGNVTKWIANYSTDGKTLSLSQIPKNDTRVYAERVVETYAIFLQNAYEPDGAVAGADAAVSAGDGHHHG